MKFDVIIGNPPYQLSDGGGTGSSAIPIYQYFVEAAMNLAPRYVTMIMPSRWFAGGKGLDDFREKMLGCKQLPLLIDFANSADCFPGVTIAGGVCYFLWDKQYNGDCVVINKIANKTISESKRALNEFPVLVRDNLAVCIIRKIKALRENTIDSIVHSRNCFGLASKQEGHLSLMPQDLTLYSLNGKSYIEPDLVIDRDNLIEKYKVIMTKAMSGGNKPSADGSYLVISATMRVLKPQEVCTETYLCVGDFDNEAEAENLMSYMRTKFFRFLLLQALTSINISKDKFCFIPMQDFKNLHRQNMYNFQSGLDRFLYEKYNLSQEEINFIESMIRTME